MAYVLSIFMLWNWIIFLWHSRARAADEAINRQKNYLAETNTLKMVEFCEEFSAHLYHTLNNVWAA